MTQVTISNFQLGWKWYTDTDDCHFRIIGLSAAILVPGTNRLYTGMGNAHTLSLPKRDCIISGIAHFPECWLKCAPGRISTTQQYLFLLKCETLEKQFSQPPEAMQFRRPLVSSSVECLVVDYNRKALRHSAEATAQGRNSGGDAGKLQNKNSKRNIITEVLEPSIDLWCLLAKKDLETYWGRAFLASGPDVGRCSAEGAT